ncbi:MAG: ABC transporter ATP-binding protein [Granulosicoccus sp.]
MMSSLLRIEGLTKSFGGVTVAKDIDFELQSGEVHCLIGPNGAGKSSLFRLVLGEHVADRGTIWFENQDITRLRSYQRIQRGISVKFQVPGIFSELSVEQNLRIAFQNAIHRDNLENSIAEVLQFIGLETVSSLTAGSLSHGQKQWLEIGMAVGVEPRLLMLDEPTAGMSPDETFKTGEMIRELNKRGITVLAIEHDMAFVQQIAHQVTVLHFGEIFAHGSVSEIINHRGVEQIYLGTKDAL